MEREREVAELEAALARARAGDGSVVVVEGPAGIGKTRLLGAAASSARASGMSVLTARGTELEREFAFGVVRQLFEQRLSTSDASERSRLLAGAAALSVAALGVDGAGNDVETSFGLIHGLYWLVANLAAERPVLLAVDDAQAADLPSLRFLAYLARRLERVDAVLVLGVRTSETAVTLLDQLAEDSGAITIEPAPLTLDGARRMLARELDAVPAEELVLACHVHTAGNPFLLREVAVTLRAERLEATADTAALIAGLNPPSVARSIQLRLQRLGPEAIAIARAVAVLGDGALVRDCAGLAGLPVAAGAAAAAKLAAMEILTEGPPLSFVHPLVGSAIGSAIAPNERTALHGGAAQMLARQGAGVETVASHLLLAEPTGDGEAARTLQRAGRLALSRGAPDAARGLLARALCEPPTEADRAAVLVELGSSELMSDDPRNAAAHLRLALDGATCARERAARATMLARAITMTDGHLAAVELLYEVIAGVGEENREEWLTLEAEAASYGALDARTARRLWQRLDRFAEFRGASAGERRVLAALSARWRYEGGVPASTMHATARRAIAAGDLLQETGSLHWIAAVSAFASSDAIAEADDGAAALAEHSRRTGWIEGFAVTGSVLTIARLREGRLDEAEQHAQSTLDALAGVDPTPLRRAVLRAAERTLAEVRLARGDHAGARALLLADKMDTSARAPQLPHLLARIHLDAGELAEALAQTELQRQFECESGLLEPEFPWRAVAAHAHAARGEHEQALVRADEQLAIAHEWGVTREIGIALRARAAAATPNQRIEVLSDAVDCLDASPARLELAKALVDLGRALRRAGQRTRAREQLERGLELAARSGASGFAGVALSELRVLGARPRRLMFSGAEALTASQRRVADMAAAGMSNRDIAQALFVTLKTVEVHLSQSYRKLGIGSRRELHRALTEGAGSRMLD